MSPEYVVLCLESACLPDSRFWSARRGNNQVGGACPLRLMLTLVFVGSSSPFRAACCALNFSNACRVVGTSFATFRTPFPRSIANPFLAPCSYFSNTLERQKWYMCICMYIYIYISVCVCVSAYVCKYVRTHLRTCVRVYLHVCL